MPWPVKRLPPSAQSSTATLGCAVLRTACMSAQLSDNLENRTAKSGCVTPGNDPTPAVHLNTPAVSCVGLFRPREGAPG
jgi:hypothetical protein